MLKNLNISYFGKLYELIKIPNENPSLKVSEIFIKENRNENINNLDIKQLCNRNFAIGADGVITIDSYYNIKIYNQDGSEAKMCGNGMRCVSKLLSYLTNKNEKRL
jgi:diaminopimelate epimerase